MNLPRTCHRVLSTLGLVCLAALATGCYSPDAPGATTGDDESGGAESGDESGGDESGGDESGGDEGPAPAPEPDPDPMPEPDPDPVPDPEPEPECVPEYEWCNGVDDDCDGMTDEICPVDGDAVVLSNDYAGTGYALGAHQAPGGVEMLDVEIYPVQAVWWIADEGDGFFRFHSAHLGSDEYSLDSGADVPYMAETGNYSGQYWRLTEVPDGCVRLTNDFLGENRSLDTGGPDFIPFMAGIEETAGQCWTVRVLE